MNGQYPKIYNVDSDQLYTVIKLMMMLYCNHGYGASLTYTM